MLVELKRDRNQFTGRIYRSVLQSSLKKSFEKPKILHEKKNINTGELHRKLDCTFSVYNLSEGEKKTYLDIGTKRLTEGERIKMGAKSPEEEADR